MVSLLKRLTVTMGHDIGYESVITGVCTWQTQDVLVWDKKAGFLHSLVSESKRLQLKWRVSTTPKLTFWRQESYWDYSQEIINILHQVYLIISRVSCTARRSKQSILKEINLNIHWKDWCWISSTLATWCKQLTVWKRPWCWERFKAKGEGGGREWDG